MTARFELPSGEQDKITGDWQAFVDSTADIGSLVEGSEPAVTDYGTIYPLDPIDGLVGDAAVVDMQGVPISEAELHRGEIELHFPLAGTASIKIGELKEETIERGRHAAVPSDTAHYFMPSADYVALVVSVPGFNEDNLVVLAPSETETPEDIAFDPKHYLGRVATAGSQADNPTAE